MGGVSIIAEFSIMSMVTNYIFVASFILSTLLASLITPGVIFVAKRLKIIDQPSPRKIHSNPVPLLGGVAIFLSFTITILIITIGGNVIDNKVGFSKLIAIIIGGFILMIGGYFDDRYNLKPSRQIFFPILAILVVVIAGVRINFVTNPIGGILHFAPLLGSSLGFIWLLGMGYTTKFLDGLDGLLTGVTAIGSIIIFIVSLRWDTPMSLTSIMSLALAGSCLGFLIFNWHPAKIFLGEGGSVYCGLMLGVLSIMTGSKIATALLIMGIPILDVLWVIIRRILQRQSPVAADRKHLHFRLIDIGLSHRQTVFFLYAVTLIFGLTSIFLHSWGKIYALLFLAVFMVTLAIILVRVYQKKYA